VDSDSGWPTQIGVADRSADWKRTLERGTYPYAEFPLTKLVFQMPSVEVDQWLCLNTLLAATLSTESAFRVHEPEPGLVRVYALQIKLPNLHLDDQDLSVRVTESYLEVRFNPKPSLPEALQAWSADA
jgi:hypothetical protein